MQEVKLILPEYALPREVVRKSVLKLLKKETSGLSVNEINMDLNWNVQLSGADEIVAANYVRRMHPTTRPVTEAKNGLEIPGYLVEPGSVGFGLFAKPAKTPTILQNDTGDD